jgi:hypothetical protein
MKAIVAILIISVVTISCKPTAMINTDYKVVEVPVIYENDTITSYELRFYKIGSSTNSMQAMFDNYGKWDTRLEGRYQENIPQLIWENLKFFETAHSSFTVSASGMENNSQFFSSFQVFDEDGKDCLEPGHPARSFWIRNFSEKIKTLGNPKEFYEVYITN